MGKQSKFALVKETKESRRLVEIFEYEVRLDARSEADRLNKASVKFHYYVMPLKVGKIQRKATH